MIVDSFIIAIILYSVSISLARKFAMDYNYTIHSNQVILCNSAYPFSCQVARMLHLFCCTSCVAPVYVALPYSLYSHVYARSRVLILSFLCPTPLPSLFPAFTLPPSLPPCLQEFIAYGTMNIISSFFSSFTAAGSLSRSVIQSTSGGKTQLVGFISSGIILVVLLWLGALFEPLPRVTTYDIYGINTTYV